MTVLALFVLMLFGAAPSSADELRPDQRYQGGTRVESSSAGVSFVIPPGWIAKFGQDARNQALVMGSNAIEGVGLVIFQSGQTATELAASLNTPQDLGDGVSLRPTGPPTTRGSRITARYQNNVYVGQALALLGPQKNNVIFFFAGPQKNEPVYAQLLTDLAASSNFLVPPVAASGQPQAPAAGSMVRAWSDVLSGQMLHYFSSYNSGGSSGGMSAHRVLHLCADGRFTYLGDSAITMNVPGASASSGGRSGFRGQWTIESPTQTNAVLVLKGEDGRQLRWPVRYDGQKTFLNGQRWLRGPSDACR